MTEENKKINDLKKKYNSKIKAKLVPDFLSDGTKFIYTILGKVLGLLILIVLPLVFFRAAQENNIGKYFEPATNDEVKIDPRNVFVSDNAKVLSEKAKKEIFNINSRFEKLPKKPQFMVITVKELPKGQKIEAYTNKLANKFGIGDKKEDTGVVYLLAERDHQARLEVGYGLEGLIPDGMTGRITDGTVKDYYRKNDFDSGIRLVADRINTLVTTGELSYEDEYDTVNPAPLDTISYLGSIQSSVLWWIVLGLLVVALWYMRKFAAYLIARLQVDEMAKHYFSDMKAIEPRLSEHEIMNGRPAVTDARIALKNTIKETLENNHPDYYDMSFAFGDATTKSVAKNVYLQDEEFKEKSMYQAHQNDWFNGRKITLFRFFDHAFVKDLDKYEATDPRNFIMTKFQRIVWHLIKFFTSKLFWITFVVIGLFGPDDFEGNILFFRIPKDFMVMIFETVAPLFQPRTTFWQIALVLGIAATLFLGYLFGANLQLSAKRKFRLDKMYNDYIKDLQGLMTAPLTSKEIIKAIETNSNKTQIELAQSTLLQNFKGLKAVASKDKTKKIRRGLRHIEVAQTELPDYYDFVFAFGWLTAAEFLTVNIPSEKFKKTNLFINHEEDWFSYLEGGSVGGTNDSSGNHSSDSGSSFGGGSFGGGGGTSSW